MCISAWRGEKKKRKKNEGVVRTRLYLSTRLKHARTQSLDSAIGPNFPGVSFVNRFYSLHSLNSRITCLKEAHNLVLIDGRGTQRPGIPWNVEIV